MHMYYTDSLITQPKKMGDSLEEFLFGDDVPPASVFQDVLGVGNDVPSDNDNDEDEYVEDDDRRYGKQEDEDFGIGIGIDVVLDDGDDDDMPVTPRILPSRPMHFAAFDPTEDLQMYVSTLPPVRGDEYDWQAERVYTQYEVDEMMKDVVPIEKYLADISRIKSRYNAERRKAKDLQQELKECRKQVHHLKKILMKK